ncbi:MAG: acyl-CoA dehydrogenase family protein [Deltaproteobacteria bacterium]|nr:acyl-CoA dehydrogenase family protein [Deltaproteobacteria bacterium]
MAADHNDAAMNLYGLDLESRQMVIDMVIQLRKKLLTRETILDLDKNEIFPEDIIREMLGPEIGLQLLFLPEAYGGMGGGARDCCEVTREMARICLGVGTAFFAIQLGADPIVVGGTAAQKERWLGAIAQGNSLVAYAVTEAGAGSNLAALATKAEPVQGDGGEVKGYVINGSKQFISTGGYADFVTVLAKTPEGPAFFVVEKGTEGFDQGKGEEKHGIRASNTSPLTFRDVFVPVENLIGGVPGQGMQQANKVFGYTRLMVAAMALGAADSALDIAVQYAKERIQFGAPLAEKQGYTHKLVVPHAVRLEAVTAFMEDVAEQLDAGGKDLQVEGSIAKLFATESANRAADDAIQALGGYGYISEFEVEKIKRDVKITCIYEGTSEIQQNIISIFRWKKTRKTKGEFYEAISREMRELGDGGGLLGTCAHALNALIDAAHENRLTRSQHIMFQLADLMAHVEIGASFVRKANTLAEGRDAEKIRAMSRIFAAEVARLTASSIPLILQGTGLLDGLKMDNFFKSVAYDELVRGQLGVINDMDTVADILFERQS